MMDDAEDEECPVCCESLDATDKAVNYCDCGYRMCIWCWNRLMETASQSSLPGKCPNCRSIYDKDKITMSTVDPEEVMEERKKKKEERKRNPGAIPKNRKDLVSDNPPSYLQHIRVVQRNLVYAVGLPLNLCREELLAEKNFFGQFGKMKKVSVNRVGPWAQAAAKGATGSCYVTYLNVNDAVRCIDAIDGAVWGGKTIKACFGTTKYCNAFLKNVICNNGDCLYLHGIADEADSFYKDEVQDGVQLVRQQLLESLKGRGKAAGAGGAAAAPGGSAAGPATPSGVLGKASAAANAAANALAAAVSSKGAATAAIAIPLKRSNSAQPTTPATAWGTTPDGALAQSPALPGMASWASTAAAPKHLPATTGPLADQEWPSLAPSSKDEGDKGPEGDSRPGPWGEKPLSRHSSMGGELAAPDTSKPPAAAAPPLAPTSTHTILKPNKAKVITVQKAGKGSKLVPAVAKLVQLQQPQPPGAADAAKDAAHSNGAAAGAKAEHAAVAPSTPPAQKKGGKSAAPAAAAGKQDGGAPAPLGAAAAAAAVAAATAAVVGTAAAAAAAEGDGKGRREGGVNGDNGVASAAGVGQVAAAPKLVKGPPPGFSAQIRPSAPHPSDVNPSIAAAIRAAAAPPASAPIPIHAPFPPTPIHNIISPSDQPVASPPRPTNNGILSSLFRPQGPPHDPPHGPLPTPTFPQLPSLRDWVQPNGATPTTSAHSSTDGPLPAPQPAKPRPPPGFSQPLYPTAKLSLAPPQQAPSTSQGDIDVNTLFSHIPPTPIDNRPWGAPPPSTSEPLHTPPPPRLQSRFAFARDEAAAPPPSAAGRPLHDPAAHAPPLHHRPPPPQQQQQQQPEELSRLFQKIAPGASVHVASMSPPSAESSALSAACSSGSGGLPNGFAPGTTPQSPNPGLALLAQLQRKLPPPGDAPPSTPAALKGLPPGMAGTFADPAILTAGRSPITAAPLHHYPHHPHHPHMQPQQQQQQGGMMQGGPPPFGLHRPGELGMGGPVGGYSPAPVDPPGMMRAPARGPPPGFSSAGGYHSGSSSNSMEFGLPSFGSGGLQGGPQGGMQRPLGGEPLLPNGHSIPNGHFLDSQKGYAPFGTRL